jgi:hypothetical protein
MSPFGHRAACRSLQLSQHGPDLLAGQHHRQAQRILGALHIVQPWQFDLQHIPVEDEDRVQSLVLGGCRNVLLLAK